MTETKIILTYKNGTLIPSFPLDLKNGQEIEVIINNSDIESISNQYLDKLDKTVKNHELNNKTRTMSLDELNELTNLD
jgi:predicted DNA-binding antitoxin AbrB/MazE fold protein